MASIHKTEKSKYWQASFCDTEGRWRLISTKQTDRKKALDVALAYEKTAARARAGELTEPQVRKVLSDILEAVTGETLRMTRTEAFLREWVSGKEAAKAESTGERYRTVIENFIEHLGARAQRPLLAIIPSDVQSFLTDRLDQGLAPKTVVVDLKVINSAFIRAMKQGIIPTNPVASVELPKVKSSERETFTPTQVAMLIQAAPSTDWRTCIKIGYYVGGRLRDCANLKWESVDLTANVIKYEQRKGRNTVTVPIHPELRKHLMSIAEKDTPEVYLCPSLAGKKTGGNHGLSAGFMSIMRAAGIDPGTIEGQGKRKFSKLSFHSLRHSMNSALANKGVSQEVRMKLTGHSSADMNRIYTHHDLDVLSKAIKKLPKLQTN